MEFLERERPYSFRFRLINSLSGGRLKKYLTKTLIFLIRARDRAKIKELSSETNLDNSYIVSNINYAIKTIYKIFEE